METSFFLFNETGFIEPNLIPLFCNKICLDSAFSFSMKCKSEIDSLSTIHTILYTDNLKITFFDHGYVIKVEGSCIRVLYLLCELGKLLPSFYLSPIQRISNEENLLFPSILKIEIIAFFLDKIFNTNDYSDTLKML